jgi:hypothetical protein
MAVALKWGDPGRTAAHVAQILHKLSALSEFVSDDNLPTPGGRSNLPEVFSWMVE